jgi:hypothetical protein
MISLFNILHQNKSQSQKLTLQQDPAAPLEPLVIPVSDMSLVPLPFSPIFKSAMDGRCGALVQL